MASYFHHALMLLLAVLAVMASWTGAKRSVAPDTVHQLPSEYRSGLLETEAKVSKTQKTERSGGGDNIGIQEKQKQKKNTNQGDEEYRDQKLPFKAMPDLHNLVIQARIEASLDREKQKRAKEAEQKKQDDAILAQAEEAEQKNRHDAVLSQAEAEEKNQDDAARTQVEAEQKRQAKVLKTQKKERSGRGDNIGIREKQQEKKKLNQGEEEYREQQLQFEATPDLQNVAFEPRGEEVEVDMGSDKENKAAKPKVDVREKQKRAKLQVLAEGQRTEAVGDQRSSMENKVNAFPVKETPKRAHALRGSKVDVDHVEQNKREAVALAKSEAEQKEAAILAKAEGAQKEKAEVLKTQKNERSSGGNTGGILENEEEKDNAAGEEEQRDQKTWLEAAPGLQNVIAEQQTDKAVVDKRPDKENKDVKPLVDIRAHLAQQEQKRARKQTRAKPKVVSGPQGEEAEVDKYFDKENKDMKPSLGLKTRLAQEEQERAKLKVVVERQRVKAVGGESSGMENKTKAIRATQMQKRANALQSISADIEQDSSEIAALAKADAEQQNKAAAILAEEAEAAIVAKEGTELKARSRPKRQDRKTKKQTVAIVEAATLPEAEAGQKRNHEAAILAKAEGAQKAEVSKTQKNERSRGGNPGGVLENQEEKGKEAAGEEEQRVQKTRLEAAPGLQNVKAVQQTDEAVVDKRRDKENKDVKPLVDIRAHLAQQEQKRARKQTSAKLKVVSGPQGEEAEVDKYFDKENKDMKPSLGLKTRLAQEEQKGAKLKVVVERQRVEAVGDESSGSENKTKAIRAKQVQKRAKALRGVRADIEQEGSEIAAVAKAEPEQQKKAAAILAEEAEAAILAKEGTELKARSRPKRQKTKAKKQTAAIVEAATLPEAEAEQTEKDENQTAMASEDLDLGGIEGAHTSKEPGWEGNAGTYRGANTSSEPVEEHPNTSESLSISRSSSIGVEERIDEGAPSLEQICDVLHDLAPDAENSKLYCVEKTVARSKTQHNSNNGLYIGCIGAQITVCYFTKGNPLDDCVKAFTLGEHSDEFSLWSSGDFKIPLKGAAGNKMVETHISGVLIQDGEGKYQLKDSKLIRTIAPIGKNTITQFTYKVPKLMVQAKWNDPISLA